MIRFSFRPRPNQVPRDGLDLGDMDVEGEFGTVTSEGHTPDQGMMVYIAATDLLDGLKRLIERGRGTFEFVGADSSFILDFSLKKGRITTSAGKEKLDESDAADVAAAAERAAQQLLAEHGRELPEDDAARGDLELVLGTFSSVVKRLR